MCHFWVVKRLIPTLKADVAADVRYLGRSSGRGRPGTGGRDDDYQGQLNAPKGIDNNEAQPRLCRRFTPLFPNLSLDELGE